MISRSPTGPSTSTRTRSPSSRRRPASRSTTPRTSTTTTSSSPRSSPTSRTASPAAPRSTSSPTGWPRRCTTSATSRTSTRARSRTSRTTSRRTSRARAFDPERNFSAPWQSGMTGLIVNNDLAPDITSINDIFDPKYKGEIEVLTELRDTVPLVMKADGVDVEDATTEDWLAAIDKIGEAVDSGQIVDFTGNDYTADLARGDVAAVIGWSGDAVQLQADDPVDRVAHARRGLHPVVGQHGDPGRCAEPDRRATPGSTTSTTRRTRPRSRTTTSTSPPSTESSRSSRSRAPTPPERPRLPERGLHRRLLVPAEPAGRGRGGDREGVPAGSHRVNRLPTSIGYP